MAAVYGNMATKATTLEAPARFSKILAGEEEEHRILLENYLERGQLPRLPQIGEGNLEPTLKMVCFNHP